MKIYFVSCILLLYIAPNLFGQTLRTVGYFTNKSGKKSSKEKFVKSLGKPSATDSSKADITGLGNFIFNKATTVQSFNLFANFASSDTAHGVIYNVNSKLYGLQKASTLKQDSIGLALLIPENSAWGIQLSFAAIKNIVKNSKDTSVLNLAGGIRFDYTTKNISVKDTTGKEKAKYQIGQFIVKPGLELAFKDAISVYVNWNFNSIATGLDDFRNVFPLAGKTNFHYFDFGLRGHYLLVSDSKTSVDLDFNFIGVNSGVRLLQNTHDKVIPLIRLGLTQSLYFK